MIIANPIFDVVFKRLMEDKKSAKFFIETILDETVTEIEIKPQEYTYTDKLAGLAVFRLDFVATILTANKNYKKILIEIQKARNPIDLMRFRNYLAEQYKKGDQVITNDGTKSFILPIVTIYLLGFNLPDIETPAVKVNRQYLDLISHKIISTKSDFIEKLTHDSYVVQLRRIGSKLRTKLEQLLSVFEQSYFVDEKGIVKQYNYEVADENIKRIIDNLHYTATEPAEKKKIEDEQEAYRVLDLAVREKTEELLIEIEKNRKALTEKD